MDLEEQKIIKRRRKAKDEGNHDQLALHCHKLGELRMNQGKYNEALRFFKESLSSCDKLGDRSRRGRAHRMVGEAYTALGEWEKALDYQTTYLGLVEQAGNVLEQQRAWASIGRLQMCYAESMAEEGEELLRREALSASRNALMKSLALAQTLNNLSKREQVEMKARLVLNLGLVQEYQGEGQEALKKLQKAVDLCESNDLTEDLCRSLGSLGSLKYRQGEFAGALGCLGRALEVAKRLPLSDKLAHTCDLLSSQADVFFALGDFTAARHVLHKAHKLHAPNSGVRESIERNLKIAVTALHAEKQLQEVEEGEWLLRKKLYENMGDCCTAVKAYKKAADYYLKMLQCSETLGETGTALSTCLISVGASYKDDKQYNLALQYFERECDLWEDNHKEMCRSLLTLASVHKLKGNWLEQLSKLEQARTQAVLSGHTKLHLETLNEIASYHRARGDPKTADEVENDIILLRSDVADTVSSSQEGTSSQEQDEVDTEVWALTNVDDLTSDASSEEEKEVKTTRLRERSKCKVQKNAKGETALHTACISGKIEQVQALLEKGHPVNVRDNAGWTPLHEAANHGWVEIAQLLLDKGANVNDKGGTECDGYTPLHDAASNGSFDVIELLLERGADVAAKTYKKPRLTPLNIFMNWHRDNKPLEETDENVYQDLFKRMRQMLERAGHSVTEEAENSVGGRSIRSTALRRESSPEPQSSLFGASSEPSTSGQSRVIINLKKKNKMRILSDVSSPEDDVGSYRFGLLRRKADSTGTRNIISDDEDEPGPSTQTRTRHGLSSPESDGDTSNVPRASSTSSHLLSSDEPSATSQYAQVMDNIRGKHRRQGAEPFKLRAAKSALLPEFEIEEEWLEDDLAANQTQPAKKMRMSMPTVPKQKSQQTRHTQYKQATQTKQGTQTKQATQAKRSTQAKQATQSRSSTMVIDSRTPSPMNYYDSDADIDDAPPVSPPRHKISPIKRSPRKSPTKPSQRLKEQVEQQIKVKVQVNDDKFLVPVPLRDLTIGWLAEEVAQRYYRLKGLLPKLSLLTKDEALLSPTDTIAVLLSSKDSEPDEVRARVESVSLPPVTNRYKEACQTHHCGEDAHLLKSLEACQATLALQLSNLLLGDQSVPLFHALARQNPLQQLCLSGCTLGDAGVEKLCPVLETLEQLTSLDLSCNNITKNSIITLGTLVANGKSLKTLISLNLSHNPLDPPSLGLLANVFEGLGTLRKLELRDCNLAMPEELSAESLPMFSLDELTELDISYNALGCQGLGHFFGRIDAWKLTKLCVAYTNSPNQEEGYSVAKEVGLLVQKAMRGEENGGAISLLDISGCSLADVDVYELLNALVDSGMSVDQLALSCNPALSALCLRYLLQHEPAMSTLTLTGCPNVVFPFQSDELPARLAFLRMSVKKAADAQPLTQAWMLAKGPCATSQVGPGGFLKLSTQ